MIFRSEWDMVQKHLTDQLNTPPSSAGGTVALRAEN